MRKRLKRLLRLRNSAGFTLAEVIIACALLGILIIGIMGFVTPILASVRDKQKNARATMLSEAIHKYIGESIQDAYFVVTLSGATSSDTTGTSPKATSAKYGETPGVTPEFPDSSGGGLGTLLSCYGNMDHNTFEIKCIGVRWHYDGSTGGRKLMLTNEVVNTEGASPSLALNKSNLVFEDCFYDDLFPIIKLENYDNQYSKLVGGVLTPQVAADDVGVAPGLRIVTEVYTKPECYSTTASKRENAMLTLGTESYVGLNTIRSSIKNKGDYEIVPNIVLNSYATALTADGSVQDDSLDGSPNTNRVCTIDGTECYYPETFIYYITRIKTPETTT